jgi:hypothetical protein
MICSSKRFSLWMFAFCLMLVAATSSPVLANAQASTTGTSSAAPASPSQTPAAPATTPKTTKAAGAPSSADIAAAKTAGKVWVNTESGVYHKGGRWYGNTKKGKFMTEADAKAAGYQEAAPKK